MHEKIPFSTRNLSLAFMLSRLGEPFEADHIYTEEFLKCKGMTAKEAWKKGEKGDVIYKFADTPRVRALCALWDEAGKAYDNQEAVPMRIDDESAVHLISAVLRARKAFANLHKQLEPLVMTGGGVPVADLKQIEGETADGRKVSYGVGTVTIPGFKVCGLKASEETRRELGV